MRRILAIVFVNVVLLCLGIVLVELVFGGWIDEHRLNRLNILRDCRREYDISELYTASDPKIIYTRDRHGLRGSHNSPHLIDILTVGGSTTDQRFVRDGETWQDVLQHKLEEEGVSVVVGNAGVDGQSSFGHIKNYQWWFDRIPGLSPKWVLYYIGLNDFHKIEGNRYDELLGAGTKSALRRRVKKNSALWHMYMMLCGTWEALVMDIGHDAVDFAAQSWVREPLQSNYHFMESRLAAYEERLLILVKLTHEFGSQPIFVTQPSRQYRIGEGGVEGRSDTGKYGENPYNGVDFYHMMKRVDGVTAAVAADHKAALIDLAAYPGWTDDDFYDFSHH